jgi:hypothetical protein
MFILTNYIGGFMANKKKEPIKKYYDKERNRFMSLRYESDTSEYPNITAGELANELGYSKSTISSLEAPDIDENAILGKTSGLFKAYHDKFGCSYEYLFGEAKLPDQKYATLDSSSPFNDFDSSSLNNLEQLLSDKEFANFNSYMLKALLAEPTALQNIMDILFRFMYYINMIYKNDSLNKAEKELQASNLWYTLNANIDAYLRDSLLPHLQVGFDKFEHKESERDKEAIARMEHEYERHLLEINAPITIRINEENIKILGQSDKDKEDGH